MVSKIRITPNWVEIRNNVRQNSNDDTFTVLCVCRLSFQKNVNVLIEAFSKLPDHFSLMVVGTGPEKNNLIELSEKLNLKQIKFVQPVKNLENIYKKANLLCLPSRWEGFPNVVAEALSFGLPCVGFQDCSGMAQLIIDSKNGVLAQGIENSQNLADAILRASKTNFDFKEIQNSIKKYSYENFINNWESIFDQ